MVRATDTKIISRIMMMCRVRVSRLVETGTTLSFRRWELMGEIGMGLEMGITIYTAMVEDCHTSECTD